MKTIFDTCVPRDEVLTGDLHEDIFAARLRDVIESRGKDPVYRDPDLFFENTYPTEGLKLLANEALGRLTGARAGSNAVLRLETSFGGGKTHNLIALYHLASGKVKRRQALAVVDAELIPKPGTIKIAGVVGSDLEATGLDHSDVKTYTLWGELAYQLGGIEGYRLAEESDRGRFAPGTSIWEQLIGDQPTLIMLDEIARHIRTAAGVPTATGKSNLAEQTVGFLMSLLEFAVSRERVVVVFTLADSTDAFGKETEQIRQELAEARRVSARQERVITPTGETEISAIITHRLFKSLDRSGAEEVAGAYRDYYAKLLEQGADLPAHAGRADFAREIVSDYPFHPELLITLSRKTSTIHNFQKTRGALRLLALVIRRLWETRPPHTYLIHSDHVDLSVGKIADELTSRLDRPAFKQVVEADIASPRAGVQSHAQVVDESWLGAGKPPYAGRAATSIFLHSLTQGIASGADPAEIALAVLRPGDDPGVVRKAADRLYGNAWFLDWDGHRFRFKTEPSLNKIISDEMGLVGKIAAKQELDTRIKRVWRKGVFEVVSFPAEADDVDDDAKEPKLALLHYDAATAEPENEAPPELVRKIFDHSGALEGYRTYKNNVLFLLADRAQVDNMVEVAQKHLAIGRIVGDAERMGEFNEEQRKELKKKHEASELEVRIAITRAYRYLYFPAADAPQKHSNLARVTLPPQEQGEVDADQSRVLLKVLQTQQKVLTSEDPPLAAAFVRSKAWDTGQAQLSTEDLRRQFARRLGLRMLLDLNHLKRVIRDGAQQGQWIYFDPGEQMGYGPPSPAPLVQISDSTILYLPEEARRLGVKIKGEAPPVKPELSERCGVCGNPIDDCTCADRIIAREPARPRGEGAPAQAFQAVADACADQRVEKIRRLVINMEGTGAEGAKEARSLGLAIPQMGKGQFRISQSLTAEFEGNESLSLNFEGAWDRYKRLKGVTDPFGQEASRLNVRMKLVADFPDGLDPTDEQFTTIRDVFATLGFGRLTIDAEPFTA